MRVTDLDYYSARYAKHCAMASSAGTDTTLLLHQQLARAYSAKFISEFNELLCPRLN